MSAHHFSTHVHLPRWAHFGQRRGRHRTHSEPHHHRPTSRFWSGLVGLVLGGIGLTALIGIGVTAEPAGTDWSNSSYATIIWLFIALFDAVALMTWGIGQGWRISERQRRPDPDHQKNDRIEPTTTSH